MLLLFTNEPLTLDVTAKLSNDESWDFWWRWIVYVLEVQILVGPLLQSSAFTLTIYVLSPTLTSLLLPIPSTVLLLSVRVAPILILVLLYKTSSK